jgi:glutamyl-tRNA synthetase
MAPIIRDRIRTLDEAVEIAGFFFRPEVDPPTESLVGRGMTPSASRAALLAAVDRIGSRAEMTASGLEELLRALAAELGLEAAQLFGMLRIAVTGQAVSPPLFETMEILGREIVLARVRRAADRLAD